MRISVISSMFPPNIIGGAEISAYNLATNFADGGDDMSVLTTAFGPSISEVINNISVTRVKMPRSYDLSSFNDQSAFRKAVWHTQDHLDPRNRRIWGDFLDRTAPDIVFVHIAQGLGYNGLLEIAKRDIPTITVLHDLSYICYKTTMFKNGKNCSVPCRLCAVSSKLKLNYLSSIPRLGIVSPSLANLRRFLTVFPLSDRPSRVILNANAYPGPDRPIERGDRFRFLYVGQITKAKGVGFLLETAEELARTLDFEMVVVGSGADLDELQGRFGSQSWLTFTGKVTQQEVANRMSEADVLCVPSIWTDNSPGVIIHALQLGLPVLGSDVGGIGELVIDGHNGALLPPGDKLAWSAALERVIHNRDELHLWSDVALAEADRFAPKRSVEQFKTMIQDVIAMPAGGKGRQV